MSTELPVRIVQDPSDGFRLLPHLETIEPDLRVSFDVLAGGRIRARMSGPALPTLRGGEHKADLLATAGEVRAAAARLCNRWKHVFVDHQPIDAAGRPQPGRLRPYASAADLSGEPPDELHAALSALTRAGASALFDVLLRGDHEPIALFRSYLAMMLASEDLRIRFDSSDLHLPWSMFCLKPAHLPDLPGAPTRSGAEPGASPEELFGLFLGHRHQIEHTGDAYQWLQRPSTAALPLSVSLNHDITVGTKTRAPEVAAVLADGTRCQVRTTYHDLVRDLGKPEFDEQLMYFWGHGHFEAAGSVPAQLVIRLSDGIPFDGGTVREVRADYRRLGTFHPFVLLNACHAGQASDDADRSCLSRALIEHGAQGVLGPQIEMPQSFAAEYALAFVTRYLHATPAATAGQVAKELARDFATRYRNPLALAYTLHCGMDSRVHRADRSASG